MEEKKDCIEEIAVLEEVDVISRGGTGTSDYNDLSNKPSINGKELSGDVSLDEIGAQAKGNYVELQKLTESLEEIDKDIDEVEKKIPDISDLASEEYVENAIQNLVDNDITTAFDLIKELQNNSKGIYVGYINSVTPSRNDMEVILKDAIKKGSCSIILRPSEGLPQDFFAISSGQNLQNYKNGGKGSIKFTDINEFSTPNGMPSVVSYTTKVDFTVAKNDEDVDVTITNVITDFISGINSTSQNAYVLHTKNETEYTPTKPYHPATKDYVDNAVSGGGSSSASSLPVIDARTETVDLDDYLEPGATYVLLGNKLVQQNPYSMLTEDGSVLMSVSQSGIQHIFINACMETYATRYAYSCFRSRGNSSFTIVDFPVALYNNNSVDVNQTSNSLNQCISAYAVSSWFKTTITNSTSAKYQLSQLSTTNKNSLVEAINELKAEIDALKTSGASLTNDDKKVEW